MSESAELEPWQQRAIDSFKKGEYTIMTAGRQTGKSVFSAQALKRLMDDLQNRPVEDLVLSEGTVFGSRYYTIEPIGGNWLDMETWCLDTFGPASTVWDGTFNSKDAGRWYMNNRKFWFREKKDCTMFVLKWR